MSISHARGARIATSCPRDLDFQFFMYHNENEYPLTTKPEDVIISLRSLPESAAWNALVCVLALVALVNVSIELTIEEYLLGLPLNQVVDIVFNVVYGIHVGAHLLDDWHRYRSEQKTITGFQLMWYLVDVASYGHYLVKLLPQQYLQQYPPPNGRDLPKFDLRYTVNMICYNTRLHRPFRFLWALNDYHLKGSIIGTLLKYWYSFCALRVIFLNMYIWSGTVVYMYYRGFVADWVQKPRANRFFRGFYALDKWFLHIGTDMPSPDDLNRFLDICVMLAGSLVVQGIATAALALSIALYMRAEEIFWQRFRLIMKEMEQTSVPLSLRQKVETFYRMYWHKQRAVSVTQLLPSYPPSFYHTIDTDIYFEAQQRSVVLRDLSYQFLSEIAKSMETINYIPGDIIVERDKNKSAIIYISYGDVEMLTAEDDETAILRFTRGSVLSPCGVCAPVAGSSSPVAVRAASFCTAHVLRVQDLWRVATRHGHLNGQTFILHSSFDEHFAKVKKHYAQRPHQTVKYKSTILELKRNLIELKKARDSSGQLLLARADVFLEIAGCYIIRNQENVSLTEESDAICLRSTFPCILQPSSSLQLLWKCFVSVIAVITAFCHPYNMVFMKTKSLEFKFFNFMVTVIYILDIIAHLSTGAKIEEGVPVTFLQTSSQQMNSFWFVLDVLATAPIFEFIGKGHFAGINKLAKLPKVFRTLKSLQGEWVYQSTALRLFSFSLLSTLLCWLVACTHQGVVCFMFQKCRVTSFINKPYWSTSNLTDPESMKPTVMYSVYWAISLITFDCHRTGPSYLHNYRSQIFMMVLLEIIVVLHIVVQSTYSATVMVTETMRDQYKACIDKVKQIFEKNDIDPILQHRFINYLQLCWYTDKAYGITHEKSSILFDLPQHVYEDISVIQTNKYILCIPFMKLLNRELMKNVAAKARLFYTSPNEILLNTSDISNEIYIIKKGICEVIDPKTRKVVSLLTPKRYFGDIECLLRLPAYYTVRAVTHVHIISISRKHLDKVIATPKIRDAILFAKQQKEYTSLAKDRCPHFLNYEMPAPSPNCEFFPLLRKHESDAAFLAPFSRLGFFSILRYVFPRFTIRPDGPYLRRYEWFRAFCALLSANIFPVYFLLVMQFEWLYYVCWVLDISAYFDIVQRMLVGYFNSKGILVYHPASTAAHYIKGALLLDLLAAMPMEHLDSIRMKADRRGDAYKVPTMMQFLMYNRFLQLYRLPAALDILNDYTDRQDVILVIKAIPLFMAVILLVASLIAEYSVIRLNVIGGGWRIIPLKKSKDTPWVEAFQSNVGYNITATPWNLVLTSYYWATYELTSTGLDIFQPNRSEILTFLVCGLLFATWMVTYFSVHVLSIRSNVNQALAGFQEHMQDLHVYMRRENISKELQREVVSYYEYTWEKTGGTDYRSVLKLCDQITLRTDAILHIYGQTFAKCPILYHCETSLLRLVGRAVHSMYCRQGMVVVGQDDVTMQMYFVDYGTMTVHNDDGVLTKLPRGSLFGNLTNTKTVVCKNKFVANCNVHLLKIEASLFYSVIQDFPTVKARMIKYRPHEENYIVGILREPSVVFSTWKVHGITSTVIKGPRSGIFKNIDSHSKLLHLYLITISMLCVYGDLYNAGFQDNRLNLILLLYILDIAFFVKILINYTLPYITEEESESSITLVSSRKKYHRDEFKYDLFSCLPFELLCYFSEDPLFALSLLRLNRLMRVVTVHTSLNRYYEHLSVNLTFLTIVRALIWTTLFVHASSCLWYLLSIVEENRKPQSSWRYNDTGQNLCCNHYMCSLYFIFSTFTQSGLGDILPRQHLEVVLVCFYMILSTMMLMIYVGEFSNIIQYKFYRVFSFYSAYLELQEFLKNNRVSENLVQLAKKYTLHVWRESRGLQVPHFLVSAPRCLRLKVMAAAYMHHLTEHPIFTTCDPAFLRHLVDHFKPYTYDEDMYVVREGEITNAMYFIHRGRVQELAEDVEEKTQVLQTRQHFGTMQGLLRETPYSHTYKTIIKSQVLTLSLDDWEYLLTLFPNNKDIIYKNFKQQRPSSEHEDEKHVQIKTAPKIHEMRSYSLTPTSTDQNLQEEAEKLPRYPPSTPASGPQFSGIPSGRVLLNAPETPPIPSEKPGATDQSSQIRQSAQPYSESDTNLWPMDSRRSYAFENPTFKPTGLMAKTREENQLTTGSSTKQGDVGLQLEDNLASAPTTKEDPNSALPLDSRRKKSLEYTVRKDEDASAKTLEPEQSRRKSVVQGIDKDIKDQELTKVSPSSNQHINRIPSEKDNDELLLTPRDNRNDEKFTSPSAEIYEKDGKQRKQDDNTFKKGQSSHSTLRLNEPLRALPDNVKEGNESFTQNAQSPKTNETDLLRKEKKDDLLLQLDEKKKESLEKFEANQKSQLQGGFDSNRLKLSSASNNQSQKQEATAVDLPTYQEPKEKQFELPLKDTFAAKKIPKAEKDSKSNEKKYLLKDDNKTIENFPKKKERTPKSSAFEKQENFASSTTLLRPRSLVSTLSAETFFKQQGNERHRSHKGKSDGDSTNLNEGILSTEYQSTKTMEGFLLQQLAESSKKPEISETSRKKGAATHKSTSDLNKSQTFLKMESVIAIEDYLAEKSGHAKQDKKDHEKHKTKQEEHKHGHVHYQEVKEQPRVPSHTEVRDSADIESERLTEDIRPTTEQSPPEPNSRSLDIEVTSLDPVQPNDKPSTSQTPPQK